MPSKSKSRSKKSRSTAYRFSVRVKKPKSAKKSMKRSSKKSMKRSSKKKSSNKGVSWFGAVAKARKELGIKGFVAIKKGTPLYNRAKEIYGK
tara:strand:+ start:881 stop:1156 length:276 start_codon:yes stop_codon:yes gene_type:complete